MRIFLQNNLKRRRRSNNILQFLRPFCGLRNFTLINSYIICIVFAYFLIFSSSVFAQENLSKNWASSWENEREYYLQALRALRKRKSNEYEVLKALLTDYPLYPYIVYNELVSRQSRISNRDVDDFLSTYGDTPLASRLRLRWLKQLQKQDKWGSFLKYYQGEKSAEFRCYYFDAKLRDTKDPLVLKQHIREIEDIWLVGKSQPDQCDPVFQWFNEQGYLSEELIWDRFSLAMQANQIRLANYLSKKLTKKEQSKAKLWLATHSNPKSSLASAKLSDDNHVNRQIILHGIKRLARKDLTIANSKWLSLRDNYAFGSDLHDEVERDLALRAAYRHDDRATPWMYSLPKDLVDPTVSMWRTRTAIRSQDWDLVLRGVAMLGAQEKAEPQWQYWKARAMEQLGMQSDAEQIYKEVSEDRSYYGFLASDKLKLPYRIETTPVLFKVEEIEEIKESPAILRAHELFVLNNLTDARREWNYATAGFTKQQLQVASALAHKWGWHDYAIRTIAKGGYFDDLDIRFPTPFDSVVNKYSQRRNLESAFIYGIIRRESAFNVQARSPVGARGLMQLMPATADQVAKQLKLKKPNRNDLYSASLNVNLGSSYISDMLKKFDGHRALASAAYNAGPHRVNAWLPEESSLPSDVWIDTIPFTETREYVRAIFAYTALFEWRMSQNPTRLSVHMQPVSSALRK